MYTNLTIFQNADSPILSGVRTGLLLQMKTIIKAGYKSCDAQHTVLEMEEKLQTHKATMKKSKKFGMMSVCSSKPSVMFLIKKHFL